ncbi:MAG: response regulator [Deltaproteobacteria bacterium]|nr:MAG: response regulator [Deltaproteobacteria bacterium]
MRPETHRLLDYREFPVLGVDDEPENLRILELGLGREFNIVTANSAEDALRVFNDRPIAVVLSDHRMPGMSGVELLARIRELDPKAMRILVTAYGDATTLGRAVNDSSIHRYIPKPWNIEEMRRVLRGAIEIYALEGERESLVRELTVLNRVSQLINQQLHLEPLLDVLLTTLIHELDYDGATLFFVDAAKRCLRPVRAEPAEGDVADFMADFAIDNERAAEFMAKLSNGEAQTLRLEDVKLLEAPLREWVTEVSAGEILVVPMVGKQAVVGFLAVDNRRGGPAFRISDRTLLEGLATQAVTAIENARLFDDLREARERADQAEHHGTLGVLSAVMAREIQDSLESVRGFLVTAASKRTDEDLGFWVEQREQTLRDEEQVRRLAATIERLGGGSGTDLRVPCDPAELVRTAVADVIGGSAADRERIRVETEPGTPKVVGVQKQLRQVLANLLENAIEASRPDLPVTLRLAPDPFGERPGVAIEVVDAGCGIPGEDLERIFDPFFTTKGSRRGLGLAVCQHFVAHHGGAIEVRSTEGEGSSFCVRLPASGEAPR